MRLLPTAFLAGCTATGTPSPGPTGADSADEQPAGGDTEVVPGAEDDGCATLYAQDRLPVFELELAREEWAGLEADYASGVKQYHPATFIYVAPSGAETVVEDAAVRLRGNPGFSWTTIRASSSMLIPSSGRRSPRPAPASRPRARPNRRRRRHRARSRTRTR